MLNDLDPILHSQLRLAVISTLASVEQADFNYLKEITRATSGNLSVQLNKLKEAGYITIRKKFKGNDTAWIFEKQDKMKKNILKKSNFQF